MLCTTLRATPNEANRDDPPTLCAGEYPQDCGAFNFVALWVCGYYLRRAMQGAVDDENPEGWRYPPAKDPG